MTSMRLVEMILASDTGTLEFYTECDKASSGEVAAALELATHPSAQVRSQLASSLPFLSEEPTPQMLQIGIVLSRDADTWVRDLACMTLGQQWREVDTVDLREALADRLDDPDRDTRCEALLGLAYRGDPRALPRVHAALTRPDGDLWRLELIAAGALADPTLHAALLEHQDGWDDEDTVRIADAARRLSDPAGPGDDVLDEMADLCRRRAHGRPDGDALRAWRTLGEMLDLVPGRARLYFEAVELRLGDDPLALAELRGNSVLGMLAAEDQPSPGVAQAGGDAVDGEE